MNSKIVILGGAGYIGTKLVDDLLKKKYFLKVIDKEWFGNHLNKNKIKFINKNILNLKYSDLLGYDTIIVLACLSNDPSSELDFKITFEINVMANNHVAEIAKKAKIKHIVYISSGSVYGVQKSNVDVTEETKLYPFSMYNKTKMISEKIFISKSNDYKLTIIRPGTVCGYSPRMRLDTVLNIFCYQAIKDNTIKVFGGKQYRPLININDLSNLIIFVIEKKIYGILNAASEVVTVDFIAKVISSKIKSKIIKYESSDPRSYKLNSNKIKKIGFKFRHNIFDSIDSILNNKENIFLNIKKSNNLEVLKRIKLDSLLN